MSPPTHQQPQWWEWWQMQAATSARIPNKAMDTIVHLPHALLLQEEPHQKISHVTVCAKVAITMTGMLIVSNWVCTHLEQSNGDKRQSPSCPSPPRQVLIAWFMNKVSKEFGSILRRIKRWQRQRVTMWRERQVERVIFERRRKKRETRRTMTMKILNCIWRSNTEEVAQIRPTATRAGGDKVQQGWSIRQNWSPILAFDIHSLVCLVVPPWLMTISIVNAMDWDNLNKS